MISSTAARFETRAGLPAKHSAGPTRPRGSSASLLDRTFQYWALSPAVILLLLLTVYPIANLLLMSLSDITYARGKAVWRFVGLAHLRDVPSDIVLRDAFINTITFVVIAVAIEMVLGFFLAMLTSRTIGRAGVYRTIMVVPILVPAIAIGSMWRLLYDVDFGLINRAIGWFGGSPIGFLGSTKYAMMSVILVDIWHWVPFVFLICLAGFESLPGETLEAASVDGAGQWQTLRFIILPLMWPTLSVALMFRSIFAFKVFDEIFLLTSGGPGTATEVISLYIYEVFFRQSRMGYGAMISVLTITMIVLLLAVFRWIRPREG